MMPEITLFGYSSGTTPVTDISLPDEMKLINTEIMAFMPTVEIGIRPKTADGLRSDIENSLERSIHENASIWTELSKL